jgi:hypothetical protein
MDDSIRVVFQSFLPNSINVGFADVVRIGYEQRECPGGGGGGEAKAPAKRKEAPAKRKRKRPRSGSGSAREASATCAPPFAINPRPQI